MVASRRPGCLPRAAQKDNRMQWIAALGLGLALSLTGCSGKQARTARMQEQQFYDEQRAACTSGNQAACDRVTVIIAQREANRSRNLRTWLWLLAQ